MGTRGILRQSFFELAARFIVRVIIEKQFAKRFVKYGFIGPQLQSDLILLERVVEILAKRETFST